jgi:hypothetical protein
MACMQRSHGRDEPDCAIVEELFAPPLSEERDVPKDFDAAIWDHWFRDSARLKIRPAERANKGGYWNLLGLSPGR